jgi:hypothetical protein
VPILRTDAERALAENEPEGELRDSGVLGRKAARTATRYTGVRGGMEHAL